MYHGVTTKDHSYFSPRHVIVSDFEKEILYYKANFDIISLEEAFKRIKNNEAFERKTITISFDDGFANNLEIALSILEKHSIPVTFFVSSVCVENNGDSILWPEFIAALRYFCKNQPIKYENEEYVDLIETTTKLPLSDRIKSMPYEERDVLLNRIDKEYKISEKIRTLPEEIWKLLNEKQLVELSESKVTTIGSHGHNHYNLGQIEPKYAHFELEHSKKLLESAIKKEVKYIAYPDGSYNASVKDMAMSMGYEGQLAVKYKLPNDKTDNRILNRFGISATTTYESNMLFLNKSF